MIRRKMRAQFITQKELYAKLRENGIDSLVALKAMHLEPDGEVSGVRNRKSRPALFRR